MTRAMSPSRRGFLGLLGAAGAVGVAGLAGCGFPRGTLGEPLTSELPLPRPFRVPLPVPRVARPVRSDGDTDYYEITQRESEVEILPGVRTAVWGYDGLFPGPTIESRSGRRTVIRHRNELPVPVAVHLHGGHTPPEHDGYPTDLVLPVGDAARSGYAGHAGRAGWSFHRGAKEYAYPLEQRAATLWYHDHRMDFTGPQMYRGLAGFHIVRDDEDDALPLPKGDKDIPLMICDRAFAADGSLRYPALDPSLRDEPGVRAAYMEGVLGDVVLVNGAPWPVLEVANTRYRFRLLNASNARHYQLALDPGPPEGASFLQVGSDGGLLPAPVEHTALRIAPAERYDVVVDFSGYPVGSEINLVNTLGSGGVGRVMRFRVARRERDEASVPGRLSEYEPLRRSQAARVREFRFRRGTVHGMKGWTINGKAFDPTRMDARPSLGDVEIWRFTTDFHHPIHLHLVNFQVLSRNGGGPRESDAGWKDTVDLEVYDEVEVITRFTGYRGRYVLHCHNLEHEDMAMMANFETV
ncbi:MAG: multicopper oxidase domain-containing protein [Streptosporangiales bacterium]|nr:multicopper oxidase domain-containing protein [Streptosporangiales bacterium]